MGSLCTVFDIQNNRTAVNNLNLLKSSRKVPNIVVRF